MNITNTFLLKSKQFQRANTNVGVMQKFILQFSRVEKAYREIEDAFIVVAKSESQKVLSDRMKRKCKIKLVNNILLHLGFPDKCFTNEEFKNMFGKSPDTENEITFQRLLIGMYCVYTYSIYSIYSKYSIMLSIYRKIANICCVADT